MTPDQQANRTDDRSRCVLEPRRLRLVGVLVILAAAGAAGRFRVVPAPKHTAAGTQYHSSDLVYVVPVPVAALARRLRRDRAQQDAVTRSAFSRSSIPTVPRFTSLSDPRWAYPRLHGSAWLVRGGHPEAGSALELWLVPCKASRSCSSVCRCSLMRAERRRWPERRTRLKAPFGSVCRLIGQLVTPVMASTRYLSPVRSQTDTEGPAHGGGKSTKHLIKTHPGIWRRGSLAFPGRAARCRGARSLPR